MIISFKHKGIELFFKTGKTSGINAKHASKLRILLTALNSAKSPQDMNAPNWNLHPLDDDLKGHWAVKVNGAWRITFKFENGHAEVVDYQNYH